MLAGFCQRFPYLADLPETTLRAVCAEMTYRKLAFNANQNPEDHVLCREGEESDSMFLLISGKVAVHVSEKEMEYRDRARAKRISPEPKSRETRGEPQAQSRARRRSSVMAGMAERMRAETESARRCVGSWASEPACVAS